jgi:hypothetical protein
VHRTKKIAAANDLGKLSQPAYGICRFALEERRLSHYKAGVFAGHLAPAASILPVIA